MRGRSFAAVAAAAVALAGTAPAQGRADFGAADDGRQVRLFSPEFTVDLPVNAGTGYHWEFGGAHSRDVRLIGRGSGATPPHAPGIVGAPATQRFTLHATGPAGEVRFGLFPPGPVRGEPERVWGLTFRSAYAGRPPPPGRDY